MEEEADEGVQVELNRLTRSLGKKLFAAASVGMDGWIFADLLDHEYMALVPSSPPRPR